MMVIFYLKFLATFVYIVNIISSYVVQRRLRIPRALIAANVTKYKILIIIIYAFFAPDYTPHTRCMCKTHACIIYIGNFASPAPHILKTSALTRKTNWVLKAFIRLSNYTQLRALALSPYTKALYILYYEPHQFLMSICALFRRISFGHTIQNNHPKDVLSRATQPHTHTTHILLQVKWNHFLYIRNARALSS